MIEKTDTGQPTWEPQFDVYMAILDGHRASFVLDMGVAPHVPVKSHPLRLEVRVKLLHPREDGLRDASELAAMGQIEDLVSKRVSAGLGGIYAGRVICEGWNTFVFYLPAAHAERVEDLVAVIGALEPYEWEWLAEDDPEWDYFTGFLYPDKLSLETMANRQLVENLEAKGDRLEVTRDIDHRAYFPTLERAAAAAVKLRSIGFRTDEVGFLEDEDRPWVLDFHRVDSLANGRPDEFCAEILNIVLPHEGTYDGWGTVVTGTAT
jgi:regulator of RNase E activity RraB